MEGTKLVSQEPADSTALLFTYLHERSCPCPGCGYNLRNLRSARCPECALELTLSVRLADPHHTPLIVGLTGLAAGAGFNGLLFLLLLYQSARTGQWRDFTESPAGVVIAGMVVEALAICLWLCNWNRIRCASPGMRNLGAIFCWGVTLTLFALFVLAIH